MRLRSSRRSWTRSGTTDGAGTRHSSTRTSRPWFTAQRAVRRRPRQAGGTGAVDDETETRILEKAEYVEEAVTVLSRKRSLERATYLDDREQRDIVEREFQTAIEACIDIAELLLKTVSADVPGVNAEKFARLEKRGLISGETAGAMQEAAGFRNVLAHTYGHDIDDERVYQHLQDNLHWFQSFLRDVRESLDDH